MRKIVAMYIKVVAVCTIHFKTQRFFYSQTDMNARELHSTNTDSSLRPHPKPQGPVITFYLHRLQERALLLRFALSHWHPWSHAGCCDMMRASDLKMQVKPCRRRLLTRQQPTTYCTYITPHLPPGPSSPFLSVSRCPSFSSTAGKPSTPQPVMTATACDDGHSL